MDDKRFDLLTKSLSGGISRRSLLRSLAAAVGVAAVWVGQSSAAPKEDTGGKKCYGGGSQCTNAKQCCSGTCTNRVCAPEGGGDPCATMNCADTNPCTTDGCAAGQCTHTPVAAGTACAGGFCNSSGTCVPAVCTPGSSESCYSGPAGTAGVGSCKAGSRTCNPTGQWGSCAGEILPTAEICGNGLDDDCDGLIDEGCGGSHCEDAAGPGTCPGEDTECQKRTCGAGLCGMDFAPTGTACQGGACDGQGTCVPITCTLGSEESCYSGDPMQKGIGVCKAGIRTCDMNGTWGPCIGEVLPTPEICGNGLDDDCDGVIDGGCNGGQCAVSTDCMGQDTECHWRTCESGYCGTAYAAIGTPLTKQTPGDCQLDICDGNGNETKKPFDEDLPDDSNPCTANICTGGVPSNPLLPVGTSCGTNLVCDANGGCVAATGSDCAQATDCGISTGGCLTFTCTNGFCHVDAFCGTCIEASDCGTDTECLTNVCTGGYCDYIYAPGNTPCNDGNTFCTLGSCF